MLVQCVHGPVFAHPFRTRELGGKKLPRNFRGAYPSRACVLQTLCARETNNHVRELSQKKAPRPRVKGRGVRGGQLVPLLANGCTKTRVHDSSLRNMPAILSLTVLLGLLTGLP